MIICPFRLVSAGSYNIAFLQTVNKFHKKTKITNSKFDINLKKTYVVRGSDLPVDKVIIAKNLKGCKNCKCYVSKKIQYQVFKLKLFLCFFFLSVSSVFIIFPFTLLTTIRATKLQRTRINKHQISIKL